VTEEVGLHIDDKGNGRHDHTSAAGGSWRPMYRVGGAGS
jgi:hypothetical protein